MPLSKEEAEAASSELLARAHADEAPRNRAAINWNWLIPLFAAGMAAIIYGTFDDSHLPLGVGIALILLCAFVVNRLFAVGTIGLFVGVAEVVIKLRNGEPWGLGPWLNAKLPQLMLLVVILVGALACLSFYMRPKPAQAVVADVAGCRLLGDWTVTYGDTLSLYTFNPDGTFVVHGDLRAPPTSTGDWTLTGGKLKMWGGLNMRRAGGAYDEVQVAWEDDKHFRMGGAEMELLRKVKGKNCSK